MISFIKGIIEEKSEDGIILDNGGIGYDIRTTSFVLQKLPPDGHEIKIYTYMQVREDGVSLFGFLTKEERNTFLLLIAINGIGPKAALSVLSTLTVDQLRYAVLSEDVKTITKTPGIGAKGAKRLIMELKDKLKLEDVFLGLENDGMGDIDIADDVRTETALALTSLGYSNSEALKAIQAVPDGDTMDTETLLKAALKKIITI